MSKKKIFLSYARRDEAIMLKLKARLCDRLMDHDVSVWSDGELKVGDDFHRVLEYQVSISDVVVFLVSTAFLNSEYCRSVEMTWALIRSNPGEARVVPVILEACEWQSTVLRHFNATPRGGKPLREFRSEPEGIGHIVDDIAQAVDDRTSYLWMGPAADVVGLPTPWRGQELTPPEFGSISALTGAVGDTIGSMLSVVDLATELGPEPDTSAHEDHAADGGDVPDEQR